MCGFSGGIVIITCEWFSCKQYYECLIMIFKVSNNYESNISGMIDYECLIMIFKVSNNYESNISGMIECILFNR